VVLFERTFDLQLIEIRFRILKTKERPSAVRRHDRYEKRLSSILSAASRVIARQGFEGASVRDVAAEGGIGLSGIYYYFKSKDELLYAIQHHAFSTIVSRLKEKLKTSTSPENRLKAIIDNHFDFFINSMDEFRVCVHEIDSLSGPYYRGVLKIRREYFRLVREVVGEVFSGSRYEASLVTLFLFGSLNWVYMWYSPEKNSNIDKLSSQFLRVFLNGVNES
jgi:AcrR family transcriptional regulator